jgi:Uncharacterized protein conserved in bacteria
MRLMIKELREQKGISIEELAGQTGVDAVFLSDLENNKVDICCAKVLAKIADILGVKAQYIFID